MAHQVRWNNYILNKFMELGCLTDLEKRIMDLRVNKEYSMIQQALTLNCSESTINRLTKRCKQKYDNCVKNYPEVFDKREFENVWK